MAWIKSLGSVMRAVTFSDGQMDRRGPMRSTRSKKNGHIEPSSQWCCGKACGHLPHEEAY